MNIITKKITIKDIAKKAGVAISTVHFALNNKSGVSESTRKKIKKIALESGYQPNLVASSLKRKKICIGVAFPIPTGDNRFYFKKVWEGVEEYIGRMSDFNVELCKIEYTDDPKNQTKKINNLLNQKKIKGLITLGHMGNYGEMSIDPFIKEDIPVVLINTDLPESGRLCSIHPNYKIIGRTLAELITRQIPDNKEILLCAGEETIPSHYLITQGFENYINEKNIGNSIKKIYDKKNKEVFYKEILKELSNKEIHACCSVNARDSVLLGKAIIETGKEGQITAVGSDLFEENFNYLRENIFTQLIYKKPYMQAFLAAKYLLEYIMQDKVPSKDTIYVNSEIVFQSNMTIYEDETYKLLF